MISPSKLLSLSLGMLFLLTGCVNPFNPSLKNSRDITPSNDSPQAVLKTLELAYRQKNLNLFKSCLDPDYRFELISSEVSQIGVDLNNDGFKDSWWDYETEVEYHQNLFTEGSSDGRLPPSQINLNLVIPPQDQWETDPQTGHEGWIIITCTFDLQLISADTYSVDSSNGSAVFFLKPVGNRWYIAIWRDQSNI